MNDQILTLPEKLLPEDGRFGAGPSKVREEQLAAIYENNPNIMGTSHRQQPVKELVHSLQEGLRTLFKLPEGYEVILGVGGATAFWDVATYSLVDKKAEHLSFGEFGAKFAAETNNAPFLDKSVIITAEPGKLAIPQAESGVDVYAWPHNETSTGVIAPVKRVQKADPDALMIIDGTSAAGGMNVDIKETDVYYFSPQKNFGSDGGLWTAIVSPAAIARSEKIKESGRWIPDFLDFSTAVDNSLKNQTYNTPALATLLTFEAQTHWLNELGGLNMSSLITQESSSYLYDWAENTSYTQPFVTNPKHRSPVIVTIDFDDAINAETISSTLRANGIVDTEPYRKLGRNQLRIATFANIDFDDVEKLVASIEYIVEHL